MRPAVRLALGLGLPVLLVVPTIPLLSRLPFVWLGLPVAAWWLFACIPLTSACLAACWWWHDRHLPGDEA